MGKKLTLLTLFPWVTMKMPDKPRAGSPVEAAFRVAQSSSSHSLALPSEVCQSVRL